MGQAVQRLGQLQIHADSLTGGYPAEDAEHPLRGSPATLRSSRGRTASPPARGRRPADRPPRRPARETRRPLLSGGSRTDRGSRARSETRTSSSCPRKSSSARSAAVWPAASPSKTSTTRSARRLSPWTWSSPRAVPRVPTTLLRSHLVRRNHVGVALDHSHPARLATGGPGEIGRIENLALLEEGRLGAVKIFCDIFSLRGHRALDFGKNSSAKSDRPASLVMNGKDQPTPKSLPHGPG